MAKKTNTYFVRQSVFTDFARDWKTTPWRMVSLNGKDMEDSISFNDLHHFPNPGAYQMRVDLGRALIAMGHELATTIIEYLDKDTGAVVITLFPTTYHPKTNIEQAMTRLNRASRRDFKHQVLLRLDLIRKFNQEKKL